MIQQIPKSIKLMSRMFTHGEMTEHALNIVGDEITISRNGVIILRGRIDLSGGTPQVVREANGWLIEHPVNVESDDLFELRISGHWFGGQELINQLWPSENMMLDAGYLITSDSGPQGLSSILAPLWLTSSGVAILADHGQGIRAGFNRTTAKQPFSVRNPVSQPFARPAPDDGTGDGLLRLSGRGLRYRLLVGRNMVESWRAVLPYLGYPPAIPPEALWRKPIWSTWAQFRTDISQKRVGDFADEIIAHGYPYGVMEIDDCWQVHYGDLSFDPVRFPEPRAMVEALHECDFAVTCWVTPFIAPDAACFEFARKRGYLLKQADGSPLPVRWWHGDGFLLDVANEEALRWFGDNLRELKSVNGLDGFKFDAGEASFAAGSNEYTRRYVSFVSANFPFCEVRSGWGNQRAPVLFRQWDKSCAWGADNGLKSIITGAFALGLAGYPFVLPDMVGGSICFQQKPDAELMVRWTQASVLFPAIQFSLAPWDYGDECERLCRDALHLRERYMERIDKAMRTAARLGEPVVKPVWWIAPDDGRALVSDDEFLIGDDLLVAPVIQPGRRARNVYIPGGDWRDSRTGETFEGPLVLQDVPAPLETLPVYLKGWTKMISTQS